MTTCFPPINIWDYIKLMVIGAASVSVSSVLKGKNGLIRVKVNLLECPWLFSSCLLGCCVYSHDIFLAAASASVFCLLILSAKLHALTCLT